MEAVEATTSVDPEQFKQGRRSYRFPIADIVQAVDSLGVGLERGDHVRIIGPDDYTCRPLPEKVIGQDAEIAYCYTIQDCDDGLLVLEPSRYNDGNYNDRGQRYILAVDSVALPQGDAMS